MKSKGVIEIVSFKQSSEVADEQVFKGFKILDDFYGNQKGYHGMSIGEGNNGCWTLVLNWDSVESEKKASSQMMNSDRTNGFKSIVDPTTVNKMILTNYSLE